MSDERVKAPYLNPKREKQQRELIESIQAQGRGREVRIPLPITWAQGNYCSICNIHDQWCEHIRPPVSHGRPAAGRAGEGTKE